MKPVKKGGMKSALLSLLIVALGSPFSTHAADLNQATRAEIEAVRGVGVELAERILMARQEGPFRSWDDLRRRVRGVGVRPLAGFAEGGWFIDGQSPFAPIKRPPGEPVPEASRSSSESSSGSSSRGALR